MGSRPEFSISEFVQARREFDDGRGPAAAWTRLNTLSLWRLDGLAERAGSRTWAILVASPDLPQSDRHGERLVQTLRSAEVAAAAFPTFWRLGDVRISISPAVVAQGVPIQQAVRLAQRYEQIAVVHVQRIPFEHIVVYDIATERGTGVDVFEPQLIVQRIVKSVGKADMAVMYQCTTLAECMAMNIKARRRAP